MRIYQVWLKGMSKFVEVNADDVNLESVDEMRGDTAHWNFTIGESDITVAGFPFAEVAYIVSVEA